MYWHFFELNRESLADNPRVSMMYRVWDKMDPMDKKSYLKKAKSLLENIENL